MIRCFTPLIELTDCDGRLFVNLGNCNCSKPTELVLYQAGCTEYETYCEVEPCTNHSFGCCSCFTLPRVVQKVREVPKRSISYPLHEVDEHGNATFVLDGKLKELGFGRYEAHIVNDGCEMQRFDIEYTCKTPTIYDITVGRNSPMGVR